MEIKRTGDVLPGYYTDILSMEIVDSLSFNNLCIYTLPRRLIDAICQQLPNLLTKQQLNILNEFANNYPDAVVFERGVAKNSRHVMEFSSSIDKSSFTALFGEASYQSVCDVIDGDVRKIDQICKAYCGWLVQQSEYQTDIAELREAMLEHQIQFSRMGKPGQTDVSAETELLPQTCTRIAELKGSVCKKWRLSSLITTELLDPFLPHLTEINWYAKDVPEGAAVPFIPDTFPIQGQGLVADQLRKSRQSKGPNHLRGWLDLTSNESDNSRPFETLARQYRLQHYWRVLKFGFPREFKRKNTFLYHVFAEFFDVSPDTIRRDVRSLKSQSNLLDIEIDTRF